MKKVLIIMSSILFLLVIYCNMDIRNVYETKERDTENEIEDCTAKIEDCFILNDVPRIYNVRCNASFSKYFMNIAELKEEAENIVLGKIVELTYSDLNATAKTYCTVEILDVLQGSEIKKNSLITVEEFQGYCRLSKFVEIYGSDHFTDYSPETAQNLFFAYSFDNEPLVQVGDQFVFFLSPQLHHEGIEGGYYATLATYMGKYKMNENGYYERYCPLEGMYDVYDSRERMIIRELPMTFEEIKAEVTK